MDGLKYHIMPYLEETSVSGIIKNAELCPKSFLIFKYVEFLTSFIISDMSRSRSCTSITRDCLSRTSLMNYLVSLYHFFKGNMVMRKVLLNLF